MLEHEGKALLRFAGVDVPAGLVLFAADAAHTWEGAFPVAVKAQIRGGGRGKRGGVVRADDADALRTAATALFASAFDGERPEAVLIEPWQPVERELYLSIAVDGRADGYVVLYSPTGGIDIEAGLPPARYPFGAAENFRNHELRAVLAPVEPDYRVAERVISVAQRLVELMAAQDCTTIEINPLAVLADKSLVAVDAKLVRDEWAAFRNADVQRMVEDEHGRAEPLLRACLDMKHMHVGLDGDIGLISGGAGMTMGAMDMIAAQGGRPACFFDCSPGPTSARGYRPAIAMLDADPKVKVILVSVFGGGTQMQRVANAMHELMAERNSTKPVVFRLDGTNVDQVPAILAKFGARNHDRLEDAVVESIRLAATAEEAA